jgi:hypothetical protein
MNLSNYYVSGVDGDSDQATEESASTANDDIVDEGSCFEQIISRNEAETFVFVLKICINLLGAVSTGATYRLLFTANENLASDSFRSVSSRSGSDEHCY